MAIRGRAGAPRAPGGRAAGAFIIRYFRSRAAMTALSIVSTAASSSARWTWAVGLATRIASEARTSAIGRRPFITRVDPVDTRSTIASARPSRGATSTAPEIEMTSTASPACSKNRRVVFGWAVAIRRPARSSIVRRSLSAGTAAAQAALSVAERSQTRQLGAGLGEQVLARDAEIRDAVPDELDDVVRPDEQDVQVEVPDARDEAALVLLEDEPGIAQQLDRRLDEPALVRDREPEPVATLERGHRSRPAG